MQVTTGIYKIENMLNGKVYIGQSKNIGRRWTQHKQRSMENGCKEYDYPLYRAFRKYGIDNFDFSILEECSEETLNEREQYWIKYFNSKKNGYNQTDGGAAAPSNQQLSREEVDQIISYLQDTNYSHSEIASMFHIATWTVSDINRGMAYSRYGIKYPIREVDNKKIENYCQDCGCEITKAAIRCRQCAAKAREVNAVSKEELKALIRTKPFTQIGKQFGVSDNAIRKWCKKYNLPTSSREIKKMSQDEWDLL